MALPKKNRITGKNSFSTIFKGGRNVGGSQLFLKLKKTGESESRFGFALSPRIIGKATARNRIRRVLSEAIKSEMTNIRNGYDVVVFVKVVGQEDSLKKDLIQTFKKAGIL